MTATATLLPATGTASVVDFDVAVCSVAHPSSVGELIRVLIEVVKDVFNSYQYREDLEKVRPQLLGNIAKLASMDKTLLLAAHRQEVNETLLELVDVLWEIDSIRMRAGSSLTVKERKSLTRKLNQIATELVGNRANRNTLKGAAVLLEATDLLRRQPVLIDIHTPAYTTLVQRATGIENLRTTPKKFEFSENIESNVLGWKLWDAESRHELVETLRERIYKSFGGEKVPPTITARRAGLIQAVNLIGEEGSLDSLIFWREEINGELNEALKTLRLVANAHTLPEIELRRLSDRLSASAQRLKNRLSGPLSLTDNAADMQNVIAARDAGITNLLLTKYPTFTLDLKRSTTASQHSQKGAETAALEGTTGNGADTEKNTQQGTDIYLYEQDGQATLEKLCAKFSPTVLTAYQKTETLMGTVERNDPSDTDKRVLLDIRKLYYPALADALQKASGYITEEAQQRAVAEEAENQFSVLQERLKKVLDRGLRRVVEEMQAQTATLRKQLEEDEEGS